MKRITQKKLLETDPHQLASLIGGDDDIGERIWNSDDLAAILRHQMTTSLQVDLAGVGSAAGRLREEAAAGGLLLKSFGDLLQHPHPPLGLLKMMKDFAKACRISPASTMPSEISSVVYFASIMVAGAPGFLRVVSDSSILLVAVAHHHRGVPVGHGVGRQGVMDHLLGGGKPGLNL
jgi:hypothetical protein